MNTKPVLDIASSMLTETDRALLRSLPVSKGAACAKGKALAEALDSVLNSRVFVDPASNDLTVADVLAVRVVGAIMSNPTAKELLALERIASSIKGPEDDKRSGESLMDRALENLSLKQGEGEGGYGD